MQLPRPFGPYTLLRRLAVGGMAEVYVAKAKGIGGFEKLVAIKVIHPRYSEDEHFVQMLVEEAKLSVLLTHVNIAQTFDLGCVDDTYCIVMEYIEGADAYRLLKRASEQRARVPSDLCAYIISEVCHGLDYAHRKRDMTGQPLAIVHRDISPQNVLISFAGEVKIVDFGIAKAALRTGQTEVGVIKGKYYYMSPEQAWADPVDQRSDIFSTGIVLHELLTGEMVYQEDNLPKLLDRVRKADIVSPSKMRPGIPAELDQIVMKAVAKNPEDRFQTAHDFGQALTQFLYQHLPSFTPARLSAMMAQIFPDELSDMTGATRLPAEQLKILSSIEKMNEEVTASGLSSGSIMRPNEFMPDSKSVIYHMEGQEFADDEETSRDLGKALTSSSRRLGTAPDNDDDDDEATYVEPKKEDDDDGGWEDATQRNPKSSELVAPVAPQSGSVPPGWEDSTFVEQEGLMAGRLRVALEREVARKNAIKPRRPERLPIPLPPGTDKTRPPEMKRPAPPPPKKPPPRKPPPRKPPARQGRPSSPGRGSSVPPPVPAALAPVGAQVVKFPKPPPRRSSPPASSPDSPPPAPTPTPSPEISSDHGPISASPSLERRLGAAAAAPDTEPMPASQLPLLSSSSGLDTDPSFSDATTHPRGAAMVLPLSQGGQVTPTGETLSSGSQQAAPPWASTPTPTPGGLTTPRSASWPPTAEVDSSEHAFTGAGIQIPSSYDEPETIPASAETYKLRAIRDPETRRRWALAAGGLALLALGSGLLVRIVSSSGSDLARLDVTSVPEGATVTINGEPVGGVTPMHNVAELSRDEQYELVVIREGYQQWSVRFQPSDGDVTEVVAVLRPITRELEVQTIPADANAPIYVNGVQHGQGQIRLPALREGDTVHLEARLRNRRDSKDIVVGPDMPGRVVLDLSR